MKFPSSIQYLLNQCLGRSASFNRTPKWIWQSMRTPEQTDLLCLNTMTLALTFVWALYLQPRLALEAGNWIILAQVATLMSCTLSLSLILNIHHLIKLGNRWQYWVILKSTGSRARLPGFQSQLSYLCVYTQLSTCALRQLLCDLNNP